MPPAGWTLRWARGGEGCSDSPLPTSGLHPPHNGKGAARPFQTPKRKSNRKKSSRFAQRFFLGSPSVPPQPLRRQLPKWGANPLSLLPMVAASSPEGGASSALTGRCVKAPPFGGAGIEQSEMTERVQPGRTPPVTAIAVPAPSEMGPLAWRESFRLKCKVFGFARGSLPEGAGKAVRL